MHHRLDGMVLACCRRAWAAARWAAAPRPSRRQVAGLAGLSLVLSVGLLRVLARPYPPLTPREAWDDYHILSELDQHHEVADALGYFVGDWPEKNRFYRPLTGVSLWLDYRIWRWNPYGYRLTNALLYTLTGVVLSLFISLLGGRRSYGAAGLAFFLLLPQQGSQASVLVLNTRGELLCGLFALAALYAALRFIADGSGGWLAVALIALICALLSKEMALALPLLLALCAMTAVWRQRRRRWAQVWRALLVGVLWAGLVVGWMYVYEACVGGRMPLPGSPLPRPIPSTPLMIAGAVLPDLLVLSLLLRRGIGWEALTSHMVHAAVVRFALWLAAMVFWARREPRLLVVYLCWTPLAWIPLGSIHVSGNHYLYLPQMNRYLALAVLAVLLGEALHRQARLRWQRAHRHSQALWRSTY